MAYRVELSTRAKRDLASIFAYIQAESSNQAFLWFQGLEETILSLSYHPERGAIVSRHSNIRRVFYGHGRSIYRITYSIGKRSEVVHVLHIRHGARQNP